MSVRVIMVSKACVSGAYQTKLEALAEFPDLELTVVVPPYWQGREGTLPLEREHVVGYQLVVSPMRFNGRFHIHYYPQLPALCRRLQPHILHMDEEPYNLATYHGLRTARACGAHTLFFSWQNLHRTYPWPFRHVEQECFRMADHALAGNADAETVLRRKGYRGPISVIPQFGVEPARFGARPASAADGPLHVAFAGRLVPEKGVHLLLEALAGLRGPWSATIVGRGPLEVKLRDDACRLGVADRVRFIGQIPSRDMPAVLHGVNALVLPSLSRHNWVEQFGRILIEAMAAEVAVIGSDSGEIPRVIGDAGMVFPEGDVAALRHCLQQLADHPTERGRLAQAGRVRVLEQFTQQMIALRTHDVYQSLMAGAFDAGGCMV